MQLHQIAPGGQINITTAEDYHAGSGVGPKNDEVAIVDTGLWIYTLTPKAPLAGRLAD